MLALSSQDTNLNLLWSTEKLEEGAGEMNEKKEEFADIPAFRPNLQDYNYIISQKRPLSILRNNSLEEDLIEKKVKKEEPVEIPAFNFNQQPLSPSSLSTSTDTQCLKPYKEPIIYNTIAIYLECNQTCLMKMFC